MKKAIAIILAAIIISTIAYAEVDLSSMSYDDLVALSQEITAEIMSRPEWKEVTVPPGVYTIGDDIPAGFYSIECVDRNSIVETNKIGSARSDFYNVLGQGKVIGKVELKDGCTISLSGTVIFRPPVTFGF